MKNNQEKLNIGINEGEREVIVDGLSRLLADTYTLYLKSQNYHWNVTGPNFLALHRLFEEQYVDLREAADLIAERIRALGHFAPGSYREYGRLTGIRETDGVLLANDMIRQLLEGHETVARTARDIFPGAEKSVDEATADLLTTRMQVHEKAAWMLRSLLEK
jgi:starvation-inducible DNA-binding protein